MSAHEVAIVGGGAAGTMLACLLAQRGVDVVLLERRTAPSGRTRAIGIHPPALAALDRAGVGASVRDEAVAIRAGLALRGGRTIARLPFGGEPIRALPQPRTEALLRERLRALDPGALREGAEVVGLEQDADGVRLALADGGRVLADRAVAADGVRSPLRAMLGIPWLPRRGAGAYAMADGPDATGLPEAALLHLEPGGIVESFPLPGRQRRWVVRLAAPEPEVGRDRLRAVLAARLGEAPPLPETAVPSAFVARQRIAATSVAGRVVLLGDAAHELSPIGGQGMGLGWLDAVALDAALGAPGRGPAARAAADDAVAAWATGRRRAAERAMRRAAWNMAMGAPASPAALAARVALVRALALPPARGAMAGAFTMRGL